jgi:hypothetical protein
VKLDQPRYPLGQELCQLIRTLQQWPRVSPFFGADGELGLLSIASSLTVQRPITTAQSERRRTFSAFIEGLTLGKGKSVYITYPVQ